jgi:hypothetical protein
MSEMSDSLISNVDNDCTENTQLKYTRQNIQLRRAEVLRLQAMGESESSIARSLGCSQALISLDVAFLKEMAKLLQSCSHNQWTRRRLQYFSHIHL